MFDLSPVESTKLREYEAVIERGLATFVEVGTALLAIRDDRLYRKTYGTFEDYCERRWDISRRRAYQLMDAAAVVGNVKNFSHGPPSVESHAACLAPLPPPLQQEAWSRAVETAPNGKPTAAHVRATVNEILIPGRQALLDHVAADPEFSLAPFGGWSESELERYEQLEANQAVLANQRCDRNLIAWAKANGRYVPIDRTSYPLGNPMRIDEFHDRADVIAWYRDHWMPYITGFVDWCGLEGKVLGCWCYPEPCHGHVILEEMKAYVGEVVDEN